MPYKELTADFVLGRVLTITTSIGAVSWRVLEMPEAEDRAGMVRCCLLTDETVRTRLHWGTVRAMLADGTIIID